MKKLLIILLFPLCLQAQDTTGYIKLGQLGFTVTTGHSNVYIGDNSHFFTSGTGTVLYTTNTETIGYSTDTLRMLIPVADTSKAILTQIFIKGYEVYKFSTGDTLSPGKLLATLGANKKPIGKPYIKTGVGIPPTGLLWADVWLTDTIVVKPNSLNAADAATGLTITGNTMQGNPPTDGYWSLVRSKFPAPNHVEFYINSLDNNCNLGLTLAGTNLRQPIGFAGYCYDASGNKEAGAGNRYGLPYKTGDYIDMWYQNGTVEFKLNGISQGVAFTSVPPGLFVTVGTSQKSIVTVKFDNFVYE